MNWETEEDWNVESITLSMTYYKGSNKVEPVNVTINNADYSNYPWATFTGATAGGKSVKLEINQETGENKVTVGGQVQNYSDNTYCSWGAAG